MQNLELKELMRLGFKIEYKKGKDNVAAYALSRKDSLVQLIFGTLDKELRKIVDIIL